MADPSNNENIDISEMSDETADLSSQEDEGPFTTAFDGFWDTSPGFLVKVENGFFGDSKNRRQFAMVKGVIQVGTMTGKSEGNQIKWSTGEVWTRVDQCLGCEKFVGKIQSLYEGVKSDILTKEQVESTIKT